LKHQPHFSTYDRVVLKQWPFIFEHCRSVLAINVGYWHKLYVLLSTTYDRFKSGALGDHNHLKDVQTGRI